MENISDNEKAYYTQLITPETVYEILKKREDRLSCPHDLARVWVREGTINLFLLKRVHNALRTLRENGKVLLIKNKSPCNDSVLRHNRYRMKLPYEQRERFKKKKVKKAKRGYSNSNAYANFYVNEIMSDLVKHPNGLLSSELFKNIFGMKVESLRKKENSYKTYQRYHASLRKLEKTKKVSITKHYPSGKLFVVPLTTEANIFRVTQDMSAEQVKPVKTELPVEHVLLESLDTETRLIRSVLDSNINGSEKLELISIIKASK